MVFLIEYISFKPVHLKFNASDAFETSRKTDAFRNWLYLLDHFLSYDWRLCENPFAKLDLLGSVLN